MDVHALGGVVLDEPLDAVHAEAVGPVAHPVPDDDGRWRGCEYSKCETSVTLDHHIFKDAAIEFMWEGCVNLRRPHATTPI